MNASIIEALASLINDCRDFRIDNRDARHTALDHSSSVEASALSLLYRIDGNAAFPQIEDGGELDYLDRLDIVWSGNRPKLRGIEVVRGVVRGVICDVSAAA